MLNFIPYNYNIYLSPKILIFFNERFGKELIFFIVKKLRKIREKNPKLILEIFIYEHDGRVFAITRKINKDGK